MDGHAGSTGSRQRMARLGAVFGVLVLTLADVQAAGAQRLQGPAPGPGLQ